MMMKKKRTPTSVQLDSEFGVIEQGCMSKCHK